MSDLVDFKERLARREYERGDGANVEVTIRWTANGYVLYVEDQTCPVDTDAHRRWLVEELRHIAQGICRNHGIDSLSRPEDWNG